jgi:hypothetical protein
MSRELGAWLRDQREKRLWTRTEMARQLIKAAQNHGDAITSEIDHVAHCIYRWERGVVGPSERYRLYYCAALGIAPDRFGVPEEEAEREGEREPVIPAVRVKEARSVAIMITVGDDGAEVRITCDSPSAVMTGPVTG